MTKIDSFVLIIGAMKSGTSSLFEYLAQHPQLATCKNKEQHFFSEAENFSLGYEHYMNSWDWHEDLHKYALESTPAYTRSTHPRKVNAAANIAKMQRETGASFKFIYIMRNPIDRIESHYNHALSWSEQETVPDLNTKAIDTEVLDTSRYAMQIEEYYQRFPASDILLLNFEDLHQNPQNLLERICNFLEIDPEYRFSDLQVYNQRGSRKVVQIPGWSNLKKTQLFGLISQSTPKFIKEIFRQMFKRKMRVQPNIKLSDAQKQYAKKELALDLQKLRQQYQVDTGLWNIKI